MSKLFNEKILLYRAQTSHDSEAFAKLYDEYVKRIYRFVYFKVGNHEEAEDITSDVFLKAWNFLQEEKEIKSFSGLLYRIARNCIIDLYRIKSANPQGSSIEKMAEDGKGEMNDGGMWQAKINQKVETEKIIIALKKLKQEYQEVITLRYVDELSVKEIMEITGKGSVTVRVTLHRALAKLKEILDQ